MYELEDALKYTHACARTLNDTHAHTHSTKTQISIAWGTVHIRSTRDHDDASYAPKRGSGDTARFVTLTSIDGVP